MSEEMKNENTVSANPSANSTSTQVVTADSVQAEEVPTIPLSSLKTINALQPEVSVHSVASTRTVTTPTPLVAQPTEYQRGWNEWVQIWWDGIRSPYFLLALMPALLGSVLAWIQTISARTPFGHLRFSHLIATIVVLILMQAGANLLNDYYDYLHGVDTTNALGPGGLIQQGLVKPMNILVIGLVLLGAGALGGLFVAAAGGFPVYLLGLLGLVCAYFYSASKRSLSALGLGELVGFAIFGPFITLGAYLVQGGRLPSTAFIYSLPLGLLAAAVIHMNNMRDSEGDLQVGKKTIAALIGLQWSRVWGVVLLLGAFAIITALGLPHNAPHLILITLWTLPTLVIIVSGLLRTDTPAGFHLVMRETLKMETYFTLLLLVALIVLAIWPVLPHLPAHLLPF